MLKKKLKGLIVLTVMGAVILSGCKTKNNQIETKNATNEEQDVSAEVQNESSEETVANEEAVPSEDKTVEMPSVDELVGDAYNLTGSYEIPFEGSEPFVFEYDYKIPEIKDDSDAAKAINKEIDDVFRDTLDYVEAVKNGETSEIYEADIVNIKYDKYLNDNILSIVVTSYGAYSDWVDYYAYNYDVETKEKVENKDILEYVGMTEEDYLKYARYSIGKSASENVNAFVGSVSDEMLQTDEYSYIKRIMPSLIGDYVNTVDVDNVTLNSPMYINENGKLVVIGLVYVPAGAGQYNHLVVVDTTLDKPQTDAYIEYSKKVHYDGFEYDCMNLYDGEGYSYDSVKDGKARMFYLGFDGKDHEIFLFQDSFTETMMGYEGTLLWEGLDENGSIYSFELTSLDGKDLPDEEKKTGKFYLKNHSHYDEATDTFDDGATFTMIEGFDLFDEGGNPVYLSRSVG